jgi:hypothetical protein
MPDGHNLTETHEGKVVFSRGEEYLMELTPKFIRKYMRNH